MFSNKLNESIRGNDMYKLEVMITNFVYRTCIILIVEYAINIQVKMIQVHKFKLKKIVAIIFNINY